MEELLERRIKMTVFDIIRQFYAKYRNHFNSHDETSAQLKIDFERLTKEDWDTASKQPLEWWKNHYRSNKISKEEWKKQNGFTGRPKGWKKPYSKFTKENLLIKAMKEDIKNKDFTRRSFCDSNSGILFDRLEKAYSPLLRIERTNK
jgi:hypothetical protein